MVADRSPFGPPRKCDRCGGSCRRESDEDGIKSDVCVACGHQHSVTTQQQPRGTVQQIAPSGAVAQQDWTAIALKQLCGVLDRLASFDDQHQAMVDEAERTHAALTAFGAVDLPALPWKAPVRKSGTITGICYRCHYKQPVIGNFNRPIINGQLRYVCRDTAACEARRA